LPSVSLPHRSRRRDGCQRREAFVKPMPSLRACRARPSGGRQAHDGWPCGGGPRDDAEGGFFGGMRSARPRGKAVRTPRHSISTTCVEDEPVAKRRQRWSWRCAFLVGVRSPPLRETGTPQGEPAASKARCIGKARCRYCGRAEPAPPRPRSATGRTGGPKRGSAPVRRDADIAGVRSPPLRETGIPTRRASAFKGEMHR